MESGKNLYVYGLNSPINSIDPLGLTVLPPGQILTYECRECARRIADEMWQKFPRDNFMRHCVASCMVCKQCPGGCRCAWIAGWWNEFTGVFDWADVRANSEGRGCSDSDNCEQCCCEKS